MTVRTLFVTKVYEQDLALPALIEDLGASIRSLAEEDHAGIRWSNEHQYAGYTSYASLNDLPKRDPAFGELARTLVRHASAFADECGFARAGRPRLDSIWANLLAARGHHSAHIHPHSSISGTLYIEVPAGSGAIRFEDPRLPLMMASPARHGDAPEELRTFVTIEPRAGLLLLWESWLRHEVLQGSGRGERLSISFNFH